MATPVNRFLDENNPVLNNPTSNSNTPATPTTQWGYDRNEAVTFDVWQTELAFDRLDGSQRETKARNSSDARYWYDNYVKQWNSGDAVKRHALDQQHGFFGGNLLDQTPAIPETNEAPPAQMSPPPEQPPILDPQPEDISPEPDEEDTNIGSDLTPEDDSTTVDTEKDTERSQDEDTNVDDDSLLTVRDVTPEDEVVDPITGTRYSTPEAARRAGITNWVWASDYNG